MALATLAPAPASGVSCDDCYFRYEGLCALAEGPCPTFRPCKERLTPQPQAQLVEPALEPAPPAYAAA